MQEGSLLFFGLLILLTALVIIRHRAKKQPIPFSLWISLSLAAALTLASKHSGIVFVVGAFGALFLNELFSWFGVAQDSKPAATGKTVNPLKWVEDEQMGNQPVSTGFRFFVARDFEPLAAPIGMVFSLIAVPILFIALSPALWNDPLARLRDLLTVRGELLAMQTAAYDGGIALDQRLSSLITEPFISAPQYFEVESWGEVPQIVAEITRYESSGLGGVQFGAVLGAALTLCAAITFMFWAITLFRRKGATHIQRATAMTLLIILVVLVASGLANPLPFQRYALPFIPIAILGASWTLARLIQRLSRFI